MATGDPYNMGAVKPWVRENATYLGQKYGLTVVGGYRSTGSVPNSDHPLGLAADLMCDIPTGNKIVADCQTNWAAYNIKYVIHNRRFWDSPTHVVPYVGPIPHIDHVHISDNATAPKGDVTLGIAPDSGGPVDGQSSSLEDLWSGITQIGSVIKGIYDAIMFLSDPTNWKRLGLALLGGVAIFMGLMSLLKGPRVIDLTKVVK